MESLPVVVVFDKLGEVVAQVFEISVFVCPDFFLLQRLHKALAFRVVPGIRQTAHASNDSMAVQDISVFGRGVLNSSIGVMDQSWSWSAVSDRLLQGIDRESGC